MEKKFIEIQVNKKPVLIAIDNISYIEPGNNNKTNVYLRIARGKDLWPKHFIADHDYDFIKRLLVL
jgi:hypothetical protein